MQFFHTSRNKPLTYLGGILHTPKLLARSFACVTLGHAMTPEHNSTVIIGGGIIGLSTAYYLALAHGGSGAGITIIDRAPELLLGASGKANGILGDYGFPSETMPLGSLSWSLHHDLATQYNGREQWGFSGIAIHRPSKRPILLSDPADDHPLPPWFHYNGHLSDKLDGDPALAARLNPKQFCEFLKQAVERMGVEVLLSSQVKRVYVESGMVEGVDVEPERHGDDTQPPLQSQRRILGRNLVIAAGPWSQRVYKSLFPASTLRIPFDQDSKSGNFIHLEVPGYINKRGFCDQVYLQGLVDKEVDLSDYLDGHIYIGGYLAARQELPEKVTDVEAQPAYIDQMWKIAQPILSASSGVSSVAEGRAYRPVLSLGRPIIAKVPLEDLAIGGTGAWLTGGVFLNVGHGSDGITLGPGSGLVMSELIRDVSPSADITCLGLPR